MFYTDSQPIINLQNGLSEIASPAQSVNPLSLILPLIAALVISMVVIPVMVRLAPRLGLIDVPDPRKVHAQPTPRVGGFGIFFGAMLPIVLLLPFDQTLTAYLAGALVLFAFGVLDDSLELGHYVKFIGQFIAVFMVVYLGDVYVTRLPFMGGELISESAGRLFTVFAMIGMINAINHSDGLDGLAGGEALLSLCCIAWLSFIAGGIFVTFIALSLVGGLFGFMRYNTYPANIFMGDGGSQFLGYSLGFLAVLLTQNVNPALSPALPALILGLPIADIIAVFVQRMYHKLNWFRATRNHIHHRLLDLGFYHHESVVLIYAVQTLLVVSAVILPYEADATIVGLYLTVVAMVFMFLLVAQRLHWRAHGVQEDEQSWESVESARLGQMLTAISYWGIAIGLSAFLLAGSFIATRIPADFTLLAMILCGLMLLRLFVSSTVRFLPLRALCYIAVVLIVYLVNTYQPPSLVGADPVTYAFFGFMLVCIAVALRFSRKVNFNLTPTDFLVVIAVISLAILSSRGGVASAITAITLKTIILFYGCELILNWMKYRWNVFTVSTLAALIVVCIRGMKFL